MRAIADHDRQRIRAVPRITLPAPSPRTLLRALPSGALALALAGQARSSGRGGLLHIAREEASLQELAAMARAFAPELDVVTLPPWDSLPYDRARPTRAATGARVVGLARLAERSDQPVLVLTTPSAVLQRVPPRARLIGREVMLSAGMELDPDWLRATLEAFGYIFDERVDEPGEAAIRGGAIDIFPTGRAEPIRLDMDAGSITTIRSFDPLDQRGTEAVATVPLLPATEAFTLPGEAVPGTRGRLLPEGEVETLFDYLPGAVLSLAAGVEQRLADWLDLVRDGHEARCLTRGVANDEAPVAPPDRLYLTAAEIATATAGPHVLVWDAAAGDVLAERLPGDPAATPAALAALARARAQAGDAVVVCLPNMGDRVTRRLGLEGPTLESWADADRVAPGEIGLLRLKLAEGFRLDGVSVLAGSAAGAVAPRAERAAPAAALAIEEPRIGDLVVEPAHGLARLSGMAMLDEAAPARECLSLEFAGEKRLLIPVTQAGCIWRYGSAAASTKPDALTGAAWLKRREQVEAEIAEAAVGIVERARAREAAEAPVISPPRAGFDRFTRRLPHTLTTDQGKAVDAILRDLARGRPMDRLVCGDVAFGKTEVALHAAAAVALAGKQVVVIAPTTLLAHQHLETFRNRFAGLGIAVDKLIRSARSAEGRTVIKGLAEGSVRVVIGTQALAAPGLRFKHLGLIVIDEEQRFGERQKRQLRGLDACRHVLTMTATPLPRSLQAALVGLIDVSVLATPPVARQPVRGFVVPFDDVTVRGALLREARRGGQSFVVCPRIDHLAPMQQRLATLIPELSLVVAHGKMRADALDAAMLDFAEGRGDVLLATNIIEAGLDIPNANTMLVWRPDRFGLAQLHQLRGRVGRGRSRASVYLLTDPAQRLGATARKRLETLATLDNPGAGFAISAADLDQRGAGDLLGDAQAGHVRVVGTELYRHMLARAVATARGEALQAEWVPEIALEVAAFIPADLVPEPDVRLEIYRRLGRLAAVEEVDELGEELADRFGQLPQPASSLLGLARLALLCRALGIASLRAGPEAVAITPREPAARSELAKRLAGRIGIRQSGERLLLEIAEPRPEARLSIVLDILGCSTAGRSGI